MTATHFDTNRRPKRSSGVFGRSTDGIALTYFNYTHDGVPYKLLDGYPKIKKTTEGTTATEKYLIRASDVDAFAYESLPPAVVIVGYAYQPKGRRMPGFASLRTVSVDFEPQGPDLPGDPFSVDPNALDGTYDPYYVATIEYSDESNDDEADPEEPESLFNLTINAGGQFLSIPANKTTLENKDNEGNANGTGEDANGAARDNQDFQMPILKTIPTIEWGVNIKRVHFPPTLAGNLKWTNLLGLLGRVNSDKIDPGTRYAPVASILYSGFSASHSFHRTPLGVTFLVWDLNLKFSQRIVTEPDGKGGATRTYGWNHVYSPNHGGWRFARKANGQPLYESFNLKNLLTF